MRHPLLEVEGGRKGKVRIAVIGIGQSLRGDDAAGLEAVRQWQEKYPETANRPEVRVEASELPGLGLIDLLDDMDAAVIVDAVKSSAKPGTIHRISPDELSAFTSDAQSAHGWGVAETLQLGRELYPTLKETSHSIDWHRGGTSFNGRWIESKCCPSHARVVLHHRK